MADEPIVVLNDSQLLLHRTTVGMEMQPPTMVDERVSDDVFTEEQSQAAALVLGVQTGLALTHHLMMETILKDDEDKQHLPRRKPRLDEKEP